MKPVAADYLPSDGPTGPEAAGVRESYWRSLHYYNLYRCIVASLLLLSPDFRPFDFDLLTQGSRELYQYGVGFYFLCTLSALLVLNRWRHRFSLQLTVQVLLDVGVMTLLMYAGNGPKGGLSAMLLVSLAGAGLVGQGRMVLFYAAVATLALLFEQLLQALQSHFDPMSFFEAGLLSAGFFTTAVSARLLARRVVANEELAWRRGVELGNQIQVSQRVIQEMQDGVLVVSPAANVRLHNPQAETLLGVPRGYRGSLQPYAPDLFQHFLHWRQGRGEGAVELVAPATGKQLFARLLSTASSEGDALVLLEDMDRLQEESQQLKLAALGRLTANIAHEIRNPLSAINHAGELLGEGCANEVDRRLVRIILDNAGRLERIVRDVLEVGRRDRRHEECLDISAALPLFAEEFVSREGIDPAVLLVSCPPGVVLSFDRAHLNQILWNLLANALRHSRREPGSVRLWAVANGTDGVEIHVADDGPGVKPELAEQIFEPFFTTHNQGTGLGLYIARELAEANRARLELVDDGAGQGAHFRLLGRSHTLCQS